MKTLAISQNVCRNSSANLSTVHAKKIEESMLTGSCASHRRLQPKATGAASDHGHATRLKEIHNYPVWCRVLLEYLLCTRVRQVSRTQTLKQPSLYHGGFRVSRCAASPAALGPRAASPAAGRRACV
jgi:hypothetical protein